MNDFDALIAELAPLAKAKSMATDKVAKAADEAGATTPGEDEGDEEGDAGDGEEDADEAGGGDGNQDDGDDMAKSFNVTMPDGKVMKVFDSCDMLKSLTAKITRLEAENGTLKAAVAAADEQMAKSLSVAVTLTGLAKIQAAGTAAHGELLKSLRTDIDRIGNKPAGRKALLHVAEKVSGTSAPEVADRKTAGDVLMSKALTAQKEGKLSAQDIAIIDNRLFRGMDIPASYLEVIG